MACNNPNCKCDKTTCACNNAATGAPARPHKPIFTPKMNRPPRAAAGFVAQPMRKALKNKVRVRGEGDAAPAATTPYSIPRYLPSQDPYGDNLRYGMARGHLSGMILRQIGLDPMSYVATPPHFTHTPEGTFITGTNTSIAPPVQKPYNCKSEVIAALAYGLKFGILGFDLVAAIGFDPYAVRSCFP